MELLSCQIYPTELHSLQTLVPDPSSQMSNPQTIVFINFFNIPSPSFLLPISFLLPSLHIPTTSTARLPRPPCCCSVLQVSVPITSFPMAFGVTEGVNTCAEVGRRTRDRFDLWEERTDWRRGSRLCWPYHKMEHKLKFVKTLMGEFNTELPGNAKNVSDSLLPAISRYNMPRHMTHSQPRDRRVPLLILIKPAMTPWYLASKENEDYAVMLSACSLSQ